VDRKTHARFLGGWARATASGYPTLTRFYFLAWNVETPYCSSSEDSRP
jgi:hypothetical protein